MRIYNMYVCMYVCSVTPPVEYKGPCYGFAQSVNLQTPVAAIGAGPKGLPLSHYCVVL